MITVSPFSPEIKTVLRGCYLPFSTFYLTLFEKYGESSHLTFRYLVPDRIASGRLFHIDWLIFSNKSFLEKVSDVTRLISRTG